MRQDMARQATGETGAARFADARTLLEAEYGSFSRNFMTSTIHGRGWIIPGEIAYELSSGRGIFGGQIWAISTAWATTDGTRRGEHPREADCFRSREEAKAFVAALRGMERAKRRAAQEASA